MKKEIKIMYNTMELDKETNEFYAPKCSIPEIMKFDSRVKYEDVVKLAVNLKSREYEKKIYADKYDCKPEEISFKTEKVREDLTMFYVYANEKLVAKTFYELCD